MTEERFAEILKVIGKPEEIEYIYTEGIEKATEKYNSQGFELSAAELTEAMDRLEKLSEEQQGQELGEEDLEAVSGGSILLGIAIGAIIGTVAYWSKRRKR